MMTVQIVRRDGVNKIVENVKQIKVSEKDGERIEIERKNGKIVMPCVDFVFVGVNRFEEKGCV